jgi:hypothetical protein
MYSKPRTTNSSIMRKFLKCTILVSIAMVLFGATVAIAQNDNVGIGTTTPAASAILDIANPYSAILGTPSKGVLVPAVTAIQRGLMESQYNDTIANGLLTYDPDNGSFWFYQYSTPVPATAPYGTWISLSTSGQAPNAAMPTGGIIMWSGTTASIPTGWSLCDGSNGSPDLTDKFIISVSSALENPGTAPVVGFYVDVEAGATVAPDRRFFKLAYIMKL